MFTIEELRLIAYALDVWSGQQDTIDDKAGWEAVDALARRVEFMLAHERMHAVMQRRHACNLAADLVVNEMLKDLGIKK